MAIFAAPRFSYTLMNGNPAPPLGEVWAQTELQLPRPAPGHFLNLFTGEVVERSPAGTLLGREIFRHFPVALLAGH
jgi:maltooligosyltrehalose synthase